MKIRTIVVDDERMARIRLKRLLSAEADVDVIAECPDGESAVKAVREHAPDLLLLDIQMPGLGGFDVLDALGEEPGPVIVFVTAFEEHAVRAFEQCALDYLLKPASAARLAKSVARVRQHLALRNPSPVALSPPAGTGEGSAAAAPTRFRVRSGQRTAFVLREEIDWIEADGNYAVLHAGRERHLLRETMAVLEAQLSPFGFYRVNRSAIVRLDGVKELQADAQGRHWATLRGGDRVQISRSIREAEERLRLRS